MVEIIAIDGPAGSGKSSVSKEVARRLGFGYLDTGAAYRALAWAVAEDKIDFPNENFDGFDYQISLNPDDFWVRSFGVDVTDEIRLPRIAESVSAVAQIPSVRVFMKGLTRRLVDESGFPGVVVEGRDITTVVAPDAQLRILLTASEAVRLARRGLENSESAENLKARDASDSKVVEFMTAAEGVYLVDTTDLDFESSVAEVLRLVEVVKHG